MSLKSDKCFLLEKLNGGIQVDLMSNIHQYVNTSSETPHAINKCST